jgi:hypothetical protein
MEKQYIATKNWQISPNNKVVEQNGSVWGSMSSRVISHEGQLCISLPDYVYPTWSAGHMDPIGISYELAQPNNDTPFTDACLERAAIEVAKDCVRFNIPPIILPFVSGNNHEAPGIARHDRSANGIKWGKTDPGSMFDDLAFQQRVVLYMTKILTADEWIRVNKAQADIMASDKDMNRLIYVLKYVFAAKGWPWPS